MKNLCIVVLGAPFFASLVSGAKVAFRLDDCQDYWISDAQTKILEVFRTEGVPVTAGISGFYFGSDPFIVGYFQDKLRNYPSWNLEIASHGWKHEDFTTFTRAQQQTLLSNTNNRVLSLLGVNITTFIPPENLFNANTETALRNLGMRYLSSQTDMDGAPSRWDATGQTLYHVPIASSTSDYLGASYFNPVSWQTTYNQILAQINNPAYGYAAVMMHPQEFSTVINGQFDNPALQSVLNNLRTLLQQLKANPNIELVPLRGLVPPSTTPTTTRVTTATPTTTRATTTTTRAATTTATPATVDSLDLTLLPASVSRTATSITVTIKYTLAVNRDLWIDLLRTSNYDWLGGSNALNLAPTSNGQVTLTFPISLSGIPSGTALYWNVYLAPVGSTDANSWTIHTLDQQKAVTAA